MKMKLRTSLCMFTAVFLFCGLTALAAPKAKSIDIETNKKTLKIGQKLEMDAEIYPDSARVKDRNILWSSSKPNVVKILRNRDDETKVKALKTGTARITVRIRGTKIKDTVKITVKKKTSKSSSTSTYTKKISAYKNDVKAYEKSITSLKPAATYKERRTQYYSWEKKLDKISDKLDLLDDQLEDKCRDGKLSWSTYRSLEKKIDKVENYIDVVEDLLDKVFDYEFDD